MQNFKVKYTKGHLVNTETGKVIILKHEGEFFLSGDNDQFLDEQDEIFMKKTAPLFGREKIDQLKQLYPHHLLILIAKAGQKLSYRIGLGKKTSEDKKMEYFFEAVLLEDLYFHSFYNSINWKLCDCLCETTNCLSDSFQMYETIRGKSLNNLFSNMVAFYFPLQRSGACNAFNTFRFIGQDKQSPLSNYTGYRSDILLSEVRDLFYQKMIIQKIRKLNDQENMMN